MEPVSARYVRLIAVAPDGPGQPGGQMAINDVQLYGDRALSVTTLSDTGVDAYSNKYRYQTISTRGFTFQAGDVVEYDVKLPTRNGGSAGSI